MSMLVFMPWCQLNASYNVGEIILRPFNLHEDNDEIESSIARHIINILSSYKNLKGEPIKEATLVIHKNGDYLHDWNDEEIEEVSECLELATFSGLSKRELFGHPIYCNTDYFTLYFQKTENSGFTSIASRRRDGRNWNIRSISDTSFTIPEHVSSITTKFLLDENLLNSLLAFRSTANTHWRIWQNAISCFNLANTDNDTVRYQTEWVLLCSAFQRILEADSKSDAVAQKFDDAFIPNKPLLASKATRKESKQGKSLGKSLRYEWMKEFYSVRGDFAHGKLQTQQPTSWEALEHIVLAAIAFPLLVRCLLEKSGNYVLNEEDQAQINAFEALADNKKFLDPPTDKRHHGDSVWSRLVAKEKRAIRLARIKKELIDY